MVKNYLTLVAFAAVCGLNANAQQLENATFDADWVNCYPWEKGDMVTTAYGTQPKGWCVSNVPNSLMPTVAAEEVGADGTGKAVKLSNVGVMGQTAPGYITLGTTWATAETQATNVRNADGGVFGGVPFTYHPDAVQLQYKHDISNGEESMSVIAYLWKGTWKQKDVPSNTAVGIFSYGTATKVDIIDRGNNVLGKECLQGGEITSTEDAALIASVEKYIPEAAEDWTTLTAELNYGDFAGQPVDVEKLNIVVSVSEFFGDRKNIIEGNSVCIDNVKLLYYHGLSALSYEGETIEFAEDTYSYDLSNVVFDAEKLNFTVKGQAAKASTTFDEETHLLTIRVEGEDIESNPESFTEYTIQFGFEKEPVVYDHTLNSLSYEGETIEFAEDTYSYDLSNVVYDPEKLSFTVNGEGATVNTTFDEETHLLTIRVEGADIESNPESFTEYTIQFGFEKEPEPVLGDLDGDGHVTVSDITLLIEIYLGAGE